MSGSNYTPENIRDDEEGRTLRAKVRNNLNYIALAMNAIQSYFASALQEVSDRIIKPALRGGFLVNDVRYSGTLTTAVNAIPTASNQTVLITAPLSITDNLTSPSNISLVVLKGGSFAITSGKTLTINGPFDACGNALSAIFSGAGTYVFGQAVRLTGSGTPEGVVAAPIGSEFLCSDGSASAILYVKESGTGTTGWQSYASKTYVDALASGLKPKAAVAVATTANITLSGEQTIDGVTTSTSRVLVKNQSTASQNGIYVSAAGAWSRATDMDADAEAPGALTFVTGGTAGSGKQYVVTTPSPITIGSTAIDWSIYFQVSATMTFTDVTINSLTASLPVFADGSKKLVSNTMTGTGNVVMSASPTLSGTMAAASGTYSGTLGVTGAGTFNGGLTAQAAAGNHRVQFLATAAGAVSDINLGRSASGNERVTIGFDATGNAAYINTAGGVAPLQLQAAGGATTVGGTSTLTGAVSMSSTLAIAGAVSLTGSDLDVARSASGSDVVVLVQNTSNTANSNARFRAMVEGSSAGDPFTRYTVKSLTDVATGIDNSDSDAYVITFATTPGGATNSQRWTSTGTSIPGTLDVTGTATLPTIVSSNTASLASFTATGHIGLGSVGAVGGSAIGATYTTNGSSLQRGFVLDVTCDSSATAQSVGIWCQLNIPNSAFSQTSAIGCYVGPITKGASASIGSVYGIFVDDQTVSGNSYAIYTNAGQVRFGGLLTPAAGINLNPYTSTLNYYDEGTYTGTLTGCTTSPTATLRYTRIGNTVNLYIPSLTGASNSITCTITGMPASIRPARDCESMSGTAIDDSTPYAGSFDVDTAGVITVSIMAVTAAPGKVGWGGFGLFKTSGIKGCEHVCLTYNVA